MTAQKIATLLLAASISFTLVYGIVFFYLQSTVSNKSLTKIDQIAAEKNPKPSNKSSATSSPAVTSSPSPAPSQSIAPHKTNKPTTKPTASPSPTASATPSPSPTASPVAACSSLATESSYDTVVKDDTPVAYFPLAESSEACDHSTNKYVGGMSGTFTNTTLPNGDIAKTFDGNETYITVPDADPLSISTTGRLTVEAWMRPDTLQFTHQEGSGYVHWMGKGETNNHEYLLRMYSQTNTESRPNRISGYAFNSTGGLGVGSYFQDSVTAGQWIHVVLVINTADTNSSYPLGYTKIYKNGTFRDKDSLNSLSIIPSNGTAPLRIGTRDLSSFFQGAIAKVAVYNYELTPFQILEHYQTMVPTVPGTARFVQNVGKVSTKTAGTTMQVTLGSTVPVGDTLIVRTLADYSASAPTITDSKGNTYTRDRTAPNSGNTIRAAIFSSPITSQLTSGDTITITTANVTARAAVIDEFAGLLTSSALDKQNGSSGSSATPGTTISITSAQANELVVGFVGVEGSMDDTYTEDSLGQYTSLTREGTVSGSDDTNVTINGGYKSVSSIGTFQYQPTLDPSRNWITFITSYKAQ